ncbi:hypothetical protein [Streptomyces mordarskii]|uniref:Uncharacterized protein n=1 Tax=Streptomyces mordarskii TaxID=1226758 RepID=A0ABN1EVD2_9ACTN
MSESLSPADAERATNLLISILSAVGDGCHTLTLMASGTAGSLVSVVPFHNTGDTTAIDEDEAENLMILLALTFRRTGGAIVRTHHSDHTSSVIGWNLHAGTAAPLNRAEIFDAYCRDTTGELIGPEPGVQYLDAPPIGV